MTALCSAGCEYEKYAAVRRLIRLCGRNVKLVMEATGEIKNVRAVIQPLRYRNNANAGGIYLPPGFSDLRITFIWGADKPLDPYRKAGLCGGQRRKLSDPQGPAGLF